MNWEYFFIGIAFFALAYFLYKFRKRGLYGNSPEYKSINSGEIFNTWIVIIMCVVAGIMCILKSIPF